MRFIPLLLLFVFRLSAQQMSINNSLTPGHQFASGSKIALIPPPGFIKVNAFSGFQKPKTSASVVMATLPVPYMELENGFTAEELKELGIELIKKEEVLFQNQPAGLYQLKQPFNGIMMRKYALMFGTEKESIIINCMYSEGDSSMQDQLWQALQTVVYVASKETNAQDEANFTIDLSGKQLKYASSIAGTLIFTTDGNFPVKTVERGFFSVGQSTVRMNITDKKKFANNLLKNLPEGGNIDVEQVDPIEIDGMQGYELQGFRSKNGEKELVYLAVLYFDQSYYILLGIASPDFDTYRNQFKTITRSFKRK